MVTLPTLEARGAPLADPKEQLRVLDALPLRGGDFEARLAENGLQPLTATGIHVFQVNVGRVCNQTCNHCHVDAGPTRTESMSAETAELALRVLAASSIPTLDITGGAPELSPVFRRLVEGARALGRRVIDRCNLTILALPRFADVPEFLAAHEVEVVASLPHYRQSQTDRQRGEGVFERSLDGLRRLNDVGYGQGGRLRLTLVTNPSGAFLPGASQATLEAEWKRELRRLHGLEFDALITITNMPIARYLEWLERTGNLAGYMEKLVAAYNPAAAPGVMCRTTLSVGWDGRLHDCDFNQMLGLETGFGAPRHLAEFDLEALARRRIVTRRHCFGCTAGAGSSCGGQTV
ncbi:MAG: arsenosugar biosynthesis radical SAM protein ArsS [Planctomycetes bacterium]|nr:arsenosugar biosynthesis radical SAM protein ArsS [Planctomycetota bacterium]